VFDTGNGHDVPLCPISLAFRLRESRGLIPQRRVGGPTLATTGRIHDGKFFSPSADGPCR